MYLSYYIIPHDKRKKSTIIISIVFDSLLVYESYQWYTPICYTKSIHHTVKITALLIVNKYMNHLSTQWNYNYIVLWKS